MIALFSGLLVPLAFFPHTLQQLANILPFRGIYDTPALLYNGCLTIHDVLMGLVHQGIWLLLLIGVGSFLARQGIRKLEVAGG